MKDPCSDMEDTVADKSAVAIALERIAASGRAAVAAVRWAD